MIEFQMEARLTPASAVPLRFDREKCVGCLRCLEACQMDILLPPENPGEPPRLFWPGECWYCGACVMECPTGAVSLRHPLMNQAAFVERSTLCEKDE